ncbi:MAG: Chaperone for flagella basal body P-ring formation [Firmicutes bacterium]|nr:Chaperone for flagella basal body P-ring formation [Bacillota bacterium]
MRKHHQNLLAILLTLILLGFSYWAGRGQPAVRQVPVVVLAQNVPAGTILQPDHLTIVEIEDHPALTGYLHSPEQAIGQWSGSELKAGELLPASRVSATPCGVKYANPRPGHRLMTIELRSGEANGFYLAAGNLIDIHMVPKQPAGAMTETFHRVPIVALIGTDGQPLTVPLESQNATALLCLDLDQVQAVRLAEAQSRDDIRVSVVNEPE